MGFVAGMAKVAGGVAVGVGLLVGCGAPGEDPAPAGAGATPTPAATATATASGAADAEAVRLGAAELQGRWWSWAATEPERTNPVADPDGTMCGRNQPQDVWFLAGTFGGRTERACDVPGDRPIAFPLVNSTGTAADCVDFMKGAKGTATLDGQAVPPERRTGDAIKVRTARGNAVTGAAGRLNATGCGLWVQLPPLAPGKHTLVIRGEAADFSTGVDYTLTVKAA
ncbi:signal protein [Streptomyces sp. NPDC048623]|uniref:signal protein n=1 Tax=Streptomyces sp. NPDC048623 TaxID=3155761 RepID=UPI00343791C8